MWFANFAKPSLLIVLSTTVMVCSALKWYPIPETAVGPPISANLGYRTQMLEGGAYMVTDGSDQAMFFIHETGILVIDTPPTMASKMYWAVRNISSLPITHIIYSHAHADHIAGAYIWGSNGVEIVAHQATAHLLARMNDPNRPPPTVTFDTQMTLVVGNQTLELSYKGLAHSAGNIFIFAPQQRILMLVDVLTPGWGPFDGLGVAENALGIYDAHDDILEYDFDYFVAGHTNAVGTRDDIEVQRQYITDLKRNCKQTIALTATKNSSLYSGIILENVTKNNPGNEWATFKQYLDVASEHCSDITNKKWSGTLAAVDVFGPANAAIVLEMLRLDYGFLGPFSGP
ncbi:MAG: hypothetical protein M1834_008779 [Cirrosporium novae-zelandiae]|nr:MAG: hypothetical protein M1834_008779 [Cirrosporium novae-zelandiae]